MRLHEEYLHRHKIGIPVIRYDTNSNVFLRSKSEPYFWRVIDIRWESCYWHPGNFTFYHMEPRSDRRRLNNVQHPFNVFWDDYEDTLSGWISNLKYDFIAVPKEEAHIVLWYLFLVTHDGYLAGSRHFGVGTKFCDLMATSIDLSLPLKEREQAAKLAEQIMVRRDSDLQCELHHLKYYIKNYADWLVRYING